jgi:DNA excision repair protein ERCC-3
VEDLIPLRDGEGSGAFRPGANPGGQKLRDPGLSAGRATESFLGNLQGGTGYGTVVLPCGGGKTIVGIDVMVKLGTHTLILAPNVSAVHQWKRELLDKTSLRADQIGEYSGQVKEIRPVTIATYQILVYRPEIDGPFPHFNLVTRESWGLIIYDEVHLLPAPIFRVTAEIQAVRRLGLTATLVREDGRENEVFSLVGPKRFDVPWKDLETGAGSPKPSARKSAWNSRRTTAALCHRRQAEKIPDRQRKPPEVFNR